MKYNMLPVLLATTFLSTSAVALMLEPTLENSAISYSEGTETDYNFTVQKADSDGNLTTKYYKIDIDEDKLSTSSNISWTALDSKPDDMTNVVEVKLPNNQEKYFKYAYTTPSGYATTSTRINNTLATSNVTDVVFSGISSTSSGGAIYNTQNNSSINIKADFIGNYAMSSSNAYGGAIYNNGTIGDITGDFIGNDADDWGGAIYNYSGAKIGNITGDFIGNYVSSTGDSGSDLPCGGAIYNKGKEYNDWGDLVVFEIGTIGDITGDFIGNYGSSTEDYIYGGAINNDGTIGDITGDFIGNYVSSTAGSAYGGAINNDGTIGDITGNFIGNYAISTAGLAIGGAICNGGTIGDITGDFIGNYVSSIDSHASSSAIYNAGTIGNITGDFIGNYAISTSYDVSGGVIVNTSTIGYITSDFIDNYVSGSSSAYGGAIDNYESISGITGDFIGNYTTSTTYYAYGGAIYNRIYATISNISGNFLNNYAKTSSDTKYALGGAIYTRSDFTFKADGKTYLFSGNYTEDSRGKINNAIWVYNRNTLSHPTLTFNIINGGTFVFDDEIDGGYTEELYDDESNFVGCEIIRNNNGYNINLHGDKYNTDKMDETNTIRFNDLVNNVYDFSLDSVQMSLGKNAVINIVHNYVASSNPYLRLDLDAVNREVGQINISGDIEGTTNVIVNVLQNKETAKENSIPFAIASNHTLSEEDAQKSFKIYRVIGSPYMWEVNYDSTDKEWGLYSTEGENPYEEDTPDTSTQPLGPIQVAPEIIGFEAVTSAAVAQTNGMVYNIMRKVGVNRLFCPGCGFYDYNWNGEAFHNAWVDTTYNGLTIEAPVEIEAKVWGIEAGSDIQHDLNNKLGIFVSYRQGNYEMDGKGEKYYSTIGSEIDIDSYLAGLYYRYDNNNWYAFTTLYGGMQNAEIKTDDGISADTDGIEFGGSIEGGYNYALSRTLSVTPSLGAFYSQISYDDATDSAGKTVEYNDLKQVELEAGAKFAHTQYTDDGFYSLYIKSSVVQTLVDGDEIDVTELGKVDTIDDKTLGRIEIGGNYGFNDNWSAYGWANYTFGSDYEATSLGAGLNYAW